MIGLGLIVILVVVVVVVVATRSSASAASPTAAPRALGSATDAVTGTSTGVGAAPDDGSLTATLDRWVEAGLLTAERAATLAEFEAARADAALPRVLGAAREPGEAEGAESLPAGAEPLPSAGERRVPVVAEALGDIGGALALAGVVLIAKRAWPDLAEPARLALVGGASGLLVGLGAWIPRRGDPAIERLRGLIWLVATACAGLAGAVAAEWAGVESDEGLALAASLAVTALAGGLWAGRARPLQQVSAMVGLLVVGGTLAGLLAPDVVVGLVVWALGVALLVLGLSHRTTAPPLTQAVGVAGAAVGAITVASNGSTFGLPFAAATALAIVGVALAPWRLPRDERLVLGLGGGFMVLMTLPGTIGYFAQSAGLATGLVVVAAGLALIVLGDRRLSVLPPLLVAAGGVAVLVGAAITSAQVEGAGPLLGIVGAVGLIVAGTRPGLSLLSVIGALGLLVDVPWAIAHFLPGEERIPIVILVSGVLLLAVAVGLARTSGRLRDELAGPVHGEPRSVASGGRVPRRRRRGG